MKRGAENQLTKDGAEEDDIEETDAQGFRKADDAVLARRPMKGLPKRSAGLGAPPSLFDSPRLGTAENASTSTPASSSPFSGFGTASSSSFTFTTPSAPSSTTSPSMFGKPSSSDSPFKFGSTAPVSSSASSATKQFASFLSPTPQVNGTTTTPPKSSDDADVKYFTDLRGLNVSLKAAIEKATKYDAFVDLSEILDNYKILRGDIQKGYEENKKPGEKATLNGSAGQPSSFGSKLSSDAASKPSTHFALPTPPASFSFGGSSTSSSLTAAVTSSSPFGGFKPSLPASSSSAAAPFSFATPPASDKVLPTSPFTLPTSSSTSSGAPSFGSSDASSKALFGGPHATTTSPFGSAGASSTGKPPVSVFGVSGSIFGNPSSLKTEGSSDSANTSAGQLSSSPFGALKGKGNVGNPVGFTFGSSTPEPDPASGSATPVAGSSTLSSIASGSHDLPSAITSTPLSGNSRGVTPASTDGGDLEESQKGILGANPNDEEGEGEEDEETLHTTRVKIYKYVEKDGAKSWVEVGVGMLRLKKHKTTGVKRLLSRNSATGKIMINFRLYSGLAPKVTKQVLNFVGHEDGKNVTYRLKTKNEETAIGLKKAIDNEVASL